jgi:acyl-coenzyme A thioesterase PaaI-like protein
MTSLTKWTVTASRLKRILNWWPPFGLGAGIRVAELSDDFRFAKTCLPLTFYNRNYVGTHFGGSLYSMCDPMYMLLLLNILGREFVVWDKAASINYRKPGTGTVSAAFSVPDELVSSLRSMTPDEKRLVDLTVDVKDEAGDVVAHVVKTLYIRRKALESKL